MTHCNSVGGLPERTLAEIEGVLQRFPQIRWVKLYGSRALGRQRPGSDIDLAFSSPDDCSAALAGAFDVARDILAGQVRGRVVVDVNA